MGEQDTHEDDASKQTSELEHKEAIDDLDVADEQSKEVVGGDPWQDHHGGG